MKSAVAAIAAAFIFTNCAPPQTVTDAGTQQDAGTQTVDAGPPDAGTPDAGTPDAGTPDAGPADAGTPGWTKRFDTPPSRATHRAFWWAPTSDMRVLSGNHATGPIQDFWRYDGTQWTETPMPESDCPERKNSSVALDEVHQRFYVFGGTWSGYPKDGGSYTVKVLGDFRSWDGTAWRDEAAHQDAGAQPSARGGAAMGYHAQAQQLVLFGGTDNVLANNETWLNAGAGWNLLVPDGGPRPSPRFNTHLVYDEARKTLVLHGGQNATAGGAPINLTDTWEFDGAAWADVTGTAAAPPGRGHAAMTYDPVRQKVVMLGGGPYFSPTPPGSAFDDFWEWNGTQWSPIATTGKRPPLRSAASLAFDKARNRLVLYGGFDAFDLNDVWELPAGSTTWEDKTPLPLPRSGFALGQKDAAEALFFGGYMSAGGRVLGDTWRWKNGKWTPLSGAGPSARSDAALAFHGAIALLVGGQFTSTSYPTDHFAMGPGADDWVALPGPTPRSQAAMAHDPKRGITVLFGGRNGPTRLDDTWVFDGTAWALKPTATKPPARKDATLLFDPVREQLVLLGGSKAGGVIANDAWTFDGTDWKELVGQTAGPTPRVWNALGIDAKGRLWSFGGYDGTTTFDDAAVFENGAWAAVTPQGPAARFSAKLLRTGADRFLLVGGSASDFVRTWVDFGDAWELGLR